MGIIISQGSLRSNQDSMECQRVLIDAKAFTTSTQPCSASGTTCLVDPALRIANFPSSKTSLIWFDLICVFFSGIFSNVRCFGHLLKGFWMIRFRIFVHDRRDWCWGGMHALKPYGWRCGKLGPLWNSTFFLPENATGPPPIGLSPVWGFPTLCI